MEMENRHSYRSVDSEPGLCRCWNVHMGFSSTSCAHSKRRGDRGVPMCDTLEWGSYMIAVVAVHIRILVKSVRNRGYKYLRMVKNNIYFRNGDVFWESYSPLKDGCWVVEVRRHSCKSFWYSFDLVYWCRMVSLWCCDRQVVLLVLSYWPISDTLCG